MKEKDLANWLVAHGANESRWNALTLQFPPTIRTRVPLRGPAFLRAWELTKQLKNRGMDETILLHAIKKVEEMEKQKPEYSKM